MMRNILVVSDTILDPIIRETNKVLSGAIYFNSVYSEDIISFLFTLSEDEFLKYDAIFIHSDQIFHQKEISWQKALCNTIEKFSKGFKKAILLSNSFSHSYSSAEMKFSFGDSFDTNFEYSAEFHQLLGHENVYVFDFLSLSYRLGNANLYNYNLGHLYQMPYTKPAVKLISEKLSEQIKWLFSEEKKAIILDCDNTLWKGILGEDGLDGIVCDKNSEGILYYNLQRFLKAKKAEGFLLCLCSKNNYADVKDAFDKKTFPLKWEDFICRKINWEDKIHNIKEIAKDLNIGADSFIFIDDNLFELNSVAELLKGVTCMHLIEDYTELLNITSSFVFRRRRILGADKEKTKQYEIENLRKNEESKYSNLEDFIKSLEIRMDIRLNDIDDLERLSQMTGKTNQFNFNKHLYTIEEMKSMIDNNNRIYSLKVSDKYGDYGTVGIIIIEINNKEATMDNFLMSCRALGKGIENSFYNQVIGDLTKETISIKRIKFVKTEKNIPAQHFIKDISI